MSSSASSPTAASSSAAASASAPSESGTRRTRTDDEEKKEENPDSILIKVETVVGKKLEVTTLGLKNTVLQLKEQIELTEGIMAAMQKLIFQGRPLVDTATIEASGIRAGSVIHMVLALRA